MGDENKTEDLKQTALSLEDIVKQQGEQLDSLGYLPNAVYNQGQLLAQIYYQICPQNGPSTSSFVKSTAEAEVPVNDEQDAYDLLINQVENENQGQDVEIIDEPLDEELGAILLSVQQEEEFGENLSEAVAKSFDLVLAQSVKKEEMDNLKSTYKIPANCKLLGVPKVNSEIWKSVALPRNVRASDAKSQFIQQGISRAMVVLAQISDSIIKNSKLLPSDLSKSTLKSLLDAAKLLGSSHREITANRRMEFKSTLAIDTTDAGNERSELLFGDNLEAKLKNSKSALRLFKSTEPRTFRGRGSRFSAPRFNPYGKPAAFTPRPNLSLNYRGQNTWKGGGSFRGKQNRFQPSTGTPKPPQQ